MVKGNGLTSAHYLIAFIDMLVEKGFDPEVLLQGCGVSFDQLKVAESYFQYSVVEQLVDRALEIMPRENLGLQLGQRLHISAHRQIGYAALTASSTEQAIHTAIRYIPLISELVSLVYVAGEDQVSIDIHLPSFVSPRVGKFIVQTLVSSFGMMMQYLLKDKANGVSIELKQSQPEKKFDTTLRVLYGCQRDRIVFNQALLGVSFTLSDESAHRQAIDACEKSLQVMRKRSSIGQQVMLQLLTHPQAISDIEAIASQWHMSSRTLRRRLQDEGLSFRDLVSNAKMQKAKKYLIEENLAITEVAYLLEYKDSANFTRAFKRSEGVTPSEFVRNAHKK